MDGYAVRSADVNADSTYTLREVGTSFAGHPYPDHIPAGHCVRIFTGAAVPKDADLVIVQENVAEQ